ncbi:glycosyltransferase [Gymnodinialimonas sp. 2305UL16-5]|uniref:glycosyltransferase n=1 Tax=Gymnodinialimonas mytili TaxID=3126503 RepID=UPI00309AB804
MNTIDICICTFQRDSVVDALHSLADLHVPKSVRLGVIVIDNDDTPSAKGRVEAAAQTLPHPVRYLHRPGRNISIARNAALDASEADGLAFLDDDTTADPDWLERLHAMHLANKSEVVLGPVEPIYPDGAPNWMPQSGIHAIKPVWVEGEIRTGYTCNVLIDRRRKAMADLRFDLSLGRSGGEDTDFFTVIHAQGGHIAYAPDAIVREPVTPGRLAFDWLARRRYRMGQTHAHILLSRKGRSRWTSLPLAAAKLIYCGMAALLTLPHARMRNMSVLRGCLHAGVIAGLVGQSHLSLYGTPDPQEGRSA